MDAIEGEVVSHGTPPRRYTPPVRWTAGMKVAFLERLAATCNVTEAAGAIQVSMQSVYGLRLRDPAFAAGWAEALYAGYQMLETRLVGHAMAGGGRTVENGAFDGIAPLDIELAVRLLTYHGRMLAGRQRRPLPVRVVTREETEASILRKLDAIERQAQR